MTQHIVEHPTPSSCFSVLSTASRSVFKMDKASSDFLNASIFEKWLFAVIEADPKLFATSAKFFAKFCSTIVR